MLDEPMLHEIHEMHGIHIEDPKWDEVCDCDEVIINDKEIVLELDFPLARSFKFPLKIDERIPNTNTVNKEGFTRKTIINCISMIYKYIYKVEEKTTSIPLLPHPSYRYKRGATNGVFGIWGHSLEDLVLHRIVYNNKKKCYQAVVSGDFTIS